MCGFTILQGSSSLTVFFPKKAQFSTWARLALSNVPNFLRKPFFCCSETLALCGRTVQTVRKDSQIKCICVAFKRKTSAQHSMTYWTARTEVLNICLYSNEWHITRRHKCPQHQFHVSAESRLQHQRWWGSGRGGEVVAAVSWPDQTTSMTTTLINGEQAVILTGHSFNTRIK